MDCPKCNASMEAVVFEGIEIDRCTQCKGIWFDRSEREALQKHPDARTLDQGDAGGDDYELHTISCPRCKVEMGHVVADFGDHHVAYERCGDCDGSFLDGGEFAKMAQGEEDTKFPSPFRALLGMKS